jgi:hypothetical protein
MFICCRCNSINAHDTADVSDRNIHITVLATVMNFLILFTWIEEAEKKSWWPTLVLLRTPAIARMKHYKWEWKQGTNFLYDCLM